MHNPATKHRRTRVALATMTLVAMAVIVPASLHAQTQESPDERPVIGLKYEDLVKTVYHVTAYEMKDGVSKGLSDLKGTHEGYVKAGVKPADIQMTAVFHSKASPHLLTDDAWDRHHNTTGGNPNTALIEELTRMGVDLELCDLARTGNEWSKSEIHPDVTLVGNAFHRLVELQAQGFLYVKF